MSEKEKLINTNEFRRKNKVSFLSTCSSCSRLPSIGGIAAHIFLKELTEGKVLSNLSPLSCVYFRAIISINVCIIQMGDCDKLKKSSK